MTSRALGPRQIRIRAELASPKHGTELVAYRNDPAALHAYDRAPGRGDARRRRPPRAFPRPLGNMAVGVVTELGSEASRFQIGDRVFGHFPDPGDPHRRGDAMPTRCRPASPPEAALCLDPAVMALPMRDANIKLGDVVAVFGLGAIGLMAVQLARLAGAARVIAVDPLANRRELGRALRRRRGTRPDRATTATRDWRSAA